MTLIELIRKIEGVAMCQPSVNMVVPMDVYRLNAIPDAKYGAFAWQQGTHRVNAANGMCTYSLLLFYVDRLTEDKGNETMIQSSGCTLLNNILQLLQADGVSLQDWSLDTFSYRFADECAGVYATVSIVEPIDTMCATEFEDKALPYLLTSQGWRVVDAGGFSVLVKINNN